MHVQCSTVPHSENHIIINYCHFITHFIFSPFFLFVLLLDKSGLKSTYEIGNNEQRSILYIEMRPLICLCIALEVTKVVFSSPSLNWNYSPGLKWTFYILKEINK